jgi:hypothetical protein
MKQYTAEELNALSKEEVVALLIQTQKQNALFMEQIATMQAQRFGRKTERLECLGQLSCFNEAEIEAAKDTDEPETEEISYTRKKRTPGKLDEMLKCYRQFVMSENRRPILSERRANVSE